LAKRNRRDGRLTVLDQFLEAIYAIIVSMGIATENVSRFKVAI